MSISETVRQNMVEGSWIRRMFEEGNILKQRYGAENVFDLTLGNPVMEPPPEFHQELKKLVERPLPGMHRYMENAGYAETRKAVAEQLSREFGIKFTLNEVIMTCGAAGALNVVLKTILNPGEEVIIFSPYFVEYINYVANHNGAVRILPTDKDFLPRMDILEANINAKTKAVLINSPNNPTGVIYSNDLLGKMVQILQKKEAEYGTQIYMLSDEPYRKLIYDGLQYPSPFFHHPRTIVVTSHSKDLALPGERIGYIVLHPACEPHADLIAGFIFCNRTLGFVNAPALMQRLISHLQGVTVSIADYEKKRDFIYQNLTGMGYRMTKPQGAFYMFPESPIEDDVSFVRELQEYKVLTVPGRGFGAPGYFRISYCVTDRTLDGSLAGFRKMAEKSGLKGSKT